MESTVVSLWLDQIKISHCVDELRTIRDQASEVLQHSDSFNDEPFRNEQVNALHDALIRRTLVLAEVEMSSRGLGNPPVAYAFLLFGSGGREEQSLWSDQDNGIVYEDTHPQQAQAVDLYFRELSVIVVQRLEQLGYPPCDGEVSCNHSMWRMSLTQWQERLNQWLDEPNWENMRYTLIVADLRPVYGDETLGYSIKRSLHKRCETEPHLLKHLLENTLHRKIALGLFGQLITERYGEAAGGVDIKYGSYIPMVNAIRLLAIQHKIEHASTIMRMKLLLQDGVIAEDLFEDWYDAFLINLKLRFLVPVVLDNGKYVSHGKLTAELLTAPVKRELKFSLHAGERLQKYVKHRIEKESR